MKNNKYRQKADTILVAIVILLLMLGLVIMLSASEYNGRVRFNDSAYYFKKQFFATALGIFVMYMISQMNYFFLIKLAPYLYVISLFLSMLVLFVGKEINGSKRWLNLGPLSFQPSEFAKFSVILFLTWQIEKAGKRALTKKFMCQIIISLIPVIALVGSNNLSTAIIILGIGAVLIFVSNPRYLPFIGMGVGAIGLAGIFLAMESYRLERIAIWRNPEKYEKGFQTIQGLYAIGSGGVFGKGAGKSIQKLGFVPEAQNDMIFSIVCEEMGMTGAIVLMLLFLILIWRLSVISMKSAELSGGLICAGIMTHMILQVILNISVVTNTIPNTGITLPFVSYGGTSIVFLLAEMGMAVSVSMHKKNPASYNKY